MGAADSHPGARHAIGEAPPSSAQADLAAAIHETTNALMVILGWIDRAREASSDRPEALAALDRAARHARAAKDAMRRTIGAQLDAAPPEPAGALAERTLDDLTVEARTHEVILESRIAPEAHGAPLPHPDAVWQILTNLLLNAVAASPHGGAVTLDVRCDGTEARFEVRDEGPGIAASQRPTLFTGGASTRAGGAGIGLRHAHALARELGGDLALLDSERGARFELRWPLTSPISSSPISSPPRPASLDGARVLLLEDDRAVIELLELSLAARGAAVTSVSSAEALDTVLDGGAYDVLLVDLSPLEGRLDATLQRARRANPEALVVVISGSVGAQPRDDVVWVRKPFEPRELVAAITRPRTAHEA